MIILNKNKWALQVLGNTQNDLSEKEFIIYLHKLSISLNLLLPTTTSTLIINNDYSIFFRCGSKLILKE